MNFPPGREDTAMNEVMYLIPQEILTATIEAMRYMLYIYYLIFYLLLFKSSFRPLTKTFMRL